MKSQFLIFKVKIILVVLLLIFGVAGHVNAQEVNSASDGATESSTIDSDQIGVAYHLSYPGLLPDHSLYFLKAARDRIMAFFISNPLKKSEFDLLQADKRIEASYLLVQKGAKISLAESTFSKGENYFEEAVNMATDAKSQGMNTLEIEKRLTDANSKHNEILVNIDKKLTKKDKEKFARERARIIELKKKVKSLSQ